MKSGVDWCCTSFFFPAAASMRKSAIPWLSFFSWFVPRALSERGNMTWTASSSMGSQRWQASLQPFFRCQFGIMRGKEEKPAPSDIRKVPAFPGKSIFKPGDDTWAWFISGGEKLLGSPYQQNEACTVFEETVKYITDYSQFSHNQKETKKRECIIDWIQGAFLPYPGFLMFRCARGKCSGAASMKQAWEWFCF